MKIYKSVWHDDLWAANNCKPEDINSFFAVFNKLAKELLELEDTNQLAKDILLDGVCAPPLATKSKFLVRTQVDGVPLLRLSYFGFSELFTPIGAIEEIYSKILEAMPLVITPQNIDYIFFPDTSSQ